MRIVRNIGHVKSDRRRSKLFVVVGLAMVVTSFVMGFVIRQANFFFLTYALLFAGFLLFNRGMRGIGRWGNNARHVREDLAIDGALTQLPDKMTTIHYGDTGNGIVDHAIVHPSGVLVFAARDYPGRAQVTGDRWRKGGSLYSRAFSFGGPQVGNPTADAKKAKATVEETLAENDLGDVPVQAAVVFTAPTAEIEADEPSLPVLALEDLPGYLRGLPAEPALKQAQRDAIVELLGQGGEVERSEPASRRRPVRMKRRAV